MAVVPALAAGFGIQPVLIGSGVCLIAVALLTYPQGAPSAPSRSPPGVAKPVGSITIGSTNSQPANCCG